MKQKLANFFSGRNGADELTRLLSVVLALLIVLSAFAGDGIKDILSVFTLALALYIIFRMFSKNLSARQAENAAYLRRKQKVKTDMELRRDMWRQRKEYKFFKCPSCKAVLRVPRGKGKIRIVCKKCGTAFEKKT